MNKWESERRALRDFQYSLRSVPQFTVVPEVQQDGYYTNEGVISLAQFGEQYGVEWEQGVKLALLDARIREVSGDDQIDDTSQPSVLEKMAKAAIILTDAFVFLDSSSFSQLENNSEKYMYNESKTVQVDGVVRIGCRCIV